MEPADRAYAAGEVARLLPHLSWLPKQVFGQIEASVAPYADGSNAANDATVTDQESVGTVLTLIHLSLMSSADHLLALKRALNPKAVLSFAPWTITRTAVEAAIRAAWLLDARDSAHDRIAKSLFLRMDDVEESRKLSSSQKSKDGDRASESLKARKDDLVKRAHELGMEVQIGNRGEATKIGDVTVKSITQIAQETFGEESLYRLLSGAGHQKTWAHFNLSMSRVDQNIMEQDMTPESMLYLVQSGLECFSKDSWRYLRYCGFSMKPLTVALNQTWPNAKGLGLTQYFWEQRLT